VLKDKLLEKETVDSEEVDELLKDSKMPAAAALYK
jgi:ATP-dependent Zn protease